MNWIPPSEPTNDASRREALLRIGYSAQEYRIDLELAWPCPGKNYLDWDGDIVMLENNGGESTD